MSKRVRFIENVSGIFGIGSVGKHLVLEDDHAADMIKAKFAVEDPEVAPAPEVKPEVKPEAKPEKKAEKKAE